ncbi:uncharacterized protein LOC118590743 [Onychomys torridus]|uniref:uncharacterized protein LOC118590743 n=1 Tax=Onychomys torridus TaxID=38674 RepID=UPI00167F34D5|nr:uncharacterized protein LOC118590743 [Onychomys torridus]
MRKKHPRILGSLRNPLPREAYQQPSSFPTSIHLIPSQLPTPRPMFQSNPLSVFYPTSFPALKNTSYFPTLIMAMPSSSCVDKLFSKHPALFEPSSCLSAFMTTSPKRAPLDSCLVSLSYQEAGYPQPDSKILQELKKSSDTEPGTGGNSWAPSALIPGEQHPETQTGNHEVEETQALAKPDAFIQYVQQQWRLTVKISYQACFRRCPCVDLGGNTGHGHHTAPACDRAMDPDLALGCSSGLDIIMPPGGSMGHSDQHGPGGNVALGN